VKFELNDALSFNMNFEIIDFQT